MNSKKGLFGEKATGEKKWYFKPFQHTVIFIYSRRWFRAEMCWNRFYGKCDRLNWLVLTDIRKLLLSKIPFDKETLHLLLFNFENGYHFVYWTHNKTQLFRSCSMTESFVLITIFRPFFEVTHAKNEFLPVAWKMNPSLLCIFQTINHGNSRSHMLWLRKNCCIIQLNRLFLR